MSKQMTRRTCYLLGLPSQNATDSVPNKTEMNFLQFWRPEVQGQGVGGFDFSGSLSHELADSCPLGMSLHGLYSPYLHL